MFRQVLQGRCSGGTEVLVAQKCKDGVMQGTTVAGKQCFSEVVSDVAWVLDQQVG